MTDKQMSGFIEFILKEGGEDATVVSLDEIADAVDLKRDKPYLINLLTGLEQAGIIEIKWKKEEDYCLRLLPKAQMFLKENKRTEERNSEIKISISGKKLFLWAFLGSLCASALVAIIAVVLVKVL